MDEEANVVDLHGLTAPIDSGTGITEHPSSISPSYILDLADDLLLEIFAIFVSDRMESGLNIPYQYVLATVCKQWRQLVLGAPLLWTKILLPLESPYNLCTYFERSKDALIDVWYDISSHWMYDESGKLSRTLDTLSSHISRLQSLTIQVWESHEVYPIFRAWKGKEASQLQNLSISTTHGTPLDTLDSSSDSFDILNWFSGLKSLQSITLERFTFRSLAPLSSLTSLKVDKLDTSLKNMKSLFDGCPSLATLVIRQLETAPPCVEEGKRQIDAPSLRSLAMNIANYHATDCGCFLPFLSAPNLQYLEYAYLWTGGMTTHHKSFFSQWTQLSNLRTLRVYSFSIWQDDISFLASLPQTTDLHIITCPVPAAVSALPYIFISTNLKSVTLNLKYETFDLFLDFLPDLPKPRRPFFLQSSEPGSLQAFEVRLKEGLGAAASVIPPPTTKGILDDYLKNQLFDDEETLSDRLWDLDGDSEGGLHGAEIDYDFDDFDDEYDDEVSEDMNDLLDDDGENNTYFSDEPEDDFW